MGPKKPLPEPPPDFESFDLEPGMMITVPDGWKVAPIHRKPAFCGACGARIGDCHHTADLRERRFDQHFVLESSRALDMPTRGYNYSSATADYEEWRAEERRAERRWSPLLVCGLAAVIIMLLVAWLVGMFLGF